MDSLVEKTFLITGGAQGIGLGIAEYLLARGAQVVIVDHDDEAGREIAEKHHGTGRVTCIHADVGDEAAVKKCLAEVRRLGPGLDGLVNNAGLTGFQRTPITDLTLGDWEKMLRTNLTGAFLMVKHAADQLRLCHGAVVNIASTRAIQSEPNCEAYAASKGGLVALTHAMAISLGPEIRVNAILPGWIEVSGLAKTTARRDIQLRAEDHHQHPVGRVGTAEDIAALCAFLLSTEAGFITGQQFVVDGGMTRRMQYLD
ncbi:MAG TPA: glucose 1-dehydrogenase [Desulforhopalus sp.]|nr:glucose 1-dehydrogenase [Desulforhopalus sp.]